MKFTWVSPDSTQIEFSKDSGTYRLLKTYDGISTSPVVHQSVSAPYQDGATLMDSRFAPRNILFDVMVTAPTLTALQAATAALARALNPLEGEGYLLFEYENGTTYKIRAIGNNTPKVSPTVRGTTYQLVTVALICYDPFWYGSPPNICYFDTSENLVYPFAYPFALPANGATQTITNDGNVQSPATIVFEGPLTNPGLYNETTDTSFNVTLTLTAGETLTITTAFGNKTATMVHDDGAEENAFQYFDPDSVLWMIQPGENIITLVYSSIGEGSKTSILWEDRYSAI